MTCSVNKFISSSNSIDEDFERLQPDACIHYINSGQWSLHELLAWCLKKTGPAAVIVSSFSLSEAAIRSFVNLIDDGLITSLKCLFDLSTKKNKFDLLMFAHNVSGRIYLNSNHSKIMIIQNENNHVVINSSANLTVNRRYESGVIITDPLLAKGYIDTINYIIDESVLLNPDDDNF
jgi:phosphatidylserine/phosphatidylglycerophosphate/cardiolipin synthase-like enzyme